MSRVLVVLAHPDDEIYLGGTIARMTKSQLHEVYIGSLADGVTSRGDKATVTVDERRAQQCAAAAVLGAHLLPTPNYPDQQLDGVLSFPMTQHVMAWIENIQPEIVFTHSRVDANKDHRQVAEAVEPAVRAKSGVREVYAFLVHPAAPFWPTTFYEITSHLNQQLAALRCYGDELAAEAEIIEARAKDYGSRCGVPYAEGFETIRRLV